MSLVENLARRSPSTTDLLREVKRLTAEHDKPATIAEKLGLDKTYMSSGSVRNASEIRSGSMEAGFAFLSLMGCNQKCNQTPDSQRYITLQKAG